MRRIVPFVAVLCLVIAFPIAGASADRVYHSAHIALSPVDGAPLSLGFVENIHVNGPNVYAHEIYVLSGAEPNATYQVTLTIWAANLTCSGDPTVVIPTAQVMTNGDGDGVGQKFFTPADADGLRGLTVSGIWTVSLEGTIEYSTACGLVTLD